MFCDHVIAYCTVYTHMTQRGQLIDCEYSICFVSVSYM